MHQTGPGTLTVRKGRPECSWPWRRVRRSAPASLVCPVRFRMAHIGSGVCADAVRLRTKGRLPGTGGSKHEKPRGWIRGQGSAAGCNMRRVGRNTQRGYTGPPPTWGNRVGLLGGWRAFWLNGPVAVVVGREDEGEDGSRIQRLMLWKAAGGVGGDTGW